MLVSKVRSPLHKVIAVSALLIAACASSSSAAPLAHQQHAGLAGDTILIIRHAEKPAKDAMSPGLTPAGAARAQAYAGYFQHLQIAGEPVRIDTLVATADTASSSRPRLTLEPLSRATGLQILRPFADDDVDQLAGWLASGAPHRTILIAWHHHKIPSMLQALGADASSLLPDAKWPGMVFDWLIVLHYNERGDLVQAQRIVEPAFAN